MFESVSLEALLIFLRGVLLVGACGVIAWAVVRWRKQMTLDAQRVFEQIDLALVELRATQEIVQRLDSRLDALAGQVEAGRQSAPPSGAASRGYDLAVRLAKRGAPIEELVATCGITRHEAELLVRLHSVRVVEKIGGARTPREPALQTGSERKPEPAARKGSLLAVG